MASNGSVEVGVVNPKFLYQHNARLCLTRLRIHDWDFLLDKLLKTDLDIYTLFGPYDLLCKYYRTAYYDTTPRLLARYDIPSALYWDDTPFNVESVEKLENRRLDWQRDVKLQPTRANFRYLDDIQRDWNCVPGAVRNTLISSGAVLPEPISNNNKNAFQDIRAFIFIKLPVITSQELELRKLVLRTQIFDHWDNKIRGLFWGFPYEQYHCVVEVAMDSFTQLREFVMEELQSIKSIRIETATHIAIYPITNRQIPISEVLGMPKEIKSPSQLSIEEILAGSEGLQMEFKSTLRWDIRAGKKNKQMEKNVAKTIAAFMNSEGGILVIGIADDRGTFGLGTDIETLNRKDTDGFEQDLQRVIKEYLGKASLPYIHTYFKKRDGKDICVVYVDGSPSPVSQPIFLTDKTTSPEQEEFYIRIGSATNRYDIKDALHYIRERWPRYKD